VSFILLLRKLVLNSIYKAQDLKREKMAMLDDLAVKYQIEGRRGYLLSFFRRASAHT
jgi:hypothetical protein